MAVVILLYDQLIFRPIVAWADKFRFEATAAQVRPKSWVYDIVRRTRLLKQWRVLPHRAPGIGCRISERRCGAAGPRHR